MGQTYCFPGWMQEVCTPRPSRSQSSWQLDKIVRARIALAETAVYKIAWTGALESVAEVGVVGEPAGASWQLAGTGCSTAHTPLNLP